MPTNLCGHFSLEIELLPVTHTSVVLRVPIRRCALAEHMVALISQRDEGQVIARKLSIAEAPSANSTEPDRNSIRVAFGPDLEAIHRPECTSQRCQESCTPSYRALVRQFGFEEEAERETGSGCLELSLEAYEA
jgi:hypothetical protein